MSPGQRIAHYQVLGKLGQGGMGAVYKALDTRLDRVVALKVISSADVTEHDRQRFRREAKAVSALNHPNIVTIFDFSNEQGADYIAMEYVEGTTLAERLQAGPMDMPEVLACARQIAHALSRAHGTGIVHRDLKPGNIMIATDAFVKVLDFGLAKRLTNANAAGSTETVTELTRAGMSPGTPAYMSPEQARGEPLDARSDIFSFGILLYEMVTGRRPFDGKSVLDVMSAVAYATQPSARSLKPDVPDAIESLIEGCLRKDPGMRIQTMQDVCETLDRLAMEAASRGYAALSSRSVVPVPAVEVVPVEQPKRRRMLWYVAAVSALAVCVLAAFAIRGRQSSGGFATSGTAYEHYQAGAAFLSRYDRKGNVDKAVSAFSKAIELDGDMAPAYAGLSEAYAAKSNVTPDPQWVRLSVDAAEKAVRLSPDLALAHVALGRARLAAGNTEGAMAELKRALELAPRHAPAYYWSGVVLAVNNDAAGAEKQLRKASELAPDDWRHLERLGELLFKNARYAEAAEVWKKALAIVPDNAALHRFIGAAEQMQGRYEEAITHLQKALEIDPSAPVYNNLGTLRFLLGRYADAVPAFEKAVELRAGSYLYWGNLGDARRWAPGLRSKSADAYARAIQLAQSELKNKPTAELRSRLGLYLAKSGQSDAARREIAALATETKPAALLFRVAVAQELTGQRQAALESLNRAIRAGYALPEIDGEPELTELRADRRYGIMVATLPRQNNR